MRPRDKNNETERRIGEDETGLKRCRRGETVFCNLGACLAQVFFRSASRLTAQGNRGKSPQAAASSALARIRRGPTASQSLKPNSSGSGLAPGGAGCRALVESGWGDTAQHSVAKMRAPPRAPPSPCTRSAHFRRERVPAFALLHRGQR